MKSSGCLSLQKHDLINLFSSDPDRYYSVALFTQKGFKRQSCTLCHKFFWSLVDRSTCPDHENYSFIGNPPTAKRLDFIAAWNEIKEYFSHNGHSITRRYPVVCRWRDDLYFTIASIVDFQRLMKGKIVFELPANPLVVPQICLRFNDIENVGLTGRHYTGFCMIGQTSDADAQGGYWKDKCIELDYGMLTNTLGIKAEEITFVEDVWMGAGSFGCSLEYYVRGLELGNAVFTEFEGNENNYRTMANKVIDMGAGLERLSWITTGTPTSYDSTFGNVISNLMDTIGIRDNSKFLTDYFGILSSKYLNFEDNTEALKRVLAKELNITYEKLIQSISPYEAIYTVADHTRTLLFAISDGALPSNVGGGYNLRVILRRALSILERLGWNIKLGEIVDMHIDYLKRMYPELEEYQDDVRTILDIESSRYIGSRERMNSIVKSLTKRKDTIKTEDLIRLYESDGITPDFLMEGGVIKNIPPTFYSKLAELHSSQKYVQEVKPYESIQQLEPTRLLYYEDQSIREFNATILKVINNQYVILDQTAFYPRGGGQEPDTGEIDGVKVIEVVKQLDVVVHKLESPTDNENIVEGRQVRGTVYDRRRNSITEHHSATHILNRSARVNLGSWVWQNSAFKDENYARLDITHHSALTREEMERIEKTANDIIRQNLPIITKIYDRGEAEQKYSFRIYQGGAVPSSNVRIVNITGWDVEACGGTHVRTTGEIGLIKITKSERIQDGVVRLEFVVGNSALRLVENQDAFLNKIAMLLGSSRDKVIESLEKEIEDHQTSKRRFRLLLKRSSDIISEKMMKQAIQMSIGAKLYSTKDEGLGEEYLIAVGEKSIEKDPTLIFVALGSDIKGIRVIVFVGFEAEKLVSAGEIARHISKELGGSGGGTRRFGQGGGKHGAKIDECINNLDQIIEKLSSKKGS
jgi:alanyl-tRNA synthetase